ncbi:unnamed protein product, partial [Ixodes pacificus]
MIPRNLGTLARLKTVVIPNSKMLTAVALSWKVIHGRMAGNTAQHAALYRCHSTLVPRWKTIKPTLFLFALRKMQFQRRNWTNGLGNGVE